LEQKNDFTIVEIENILEYEIESGTIELVKYDEISFVISFRYLSSTEDVEINFDVNDIEYH